MEITLVVIGLLAVTVVVVGWVVVRWRNVMRQGGVNVALRWRVTIEDQGWHLGIGRYQGEDFAWFRVLSVRNGPDRMFARGDLHIVQRREPSSAERYELPQGAIVLRCELAEDDAPFEMAMASEALNGFLSWLESAPPGRQLPRAS